MSHHLEVVGVLTRLLENTSQSRLEILSKRKNIVIEKVLEERLVYGHWMSLILLSGKSVRILFKVHYLTNSAKFFAEKTYALSKESLSQSRALDFFREFCNLTAGSLKIALASNNLKVGISLPILARGFDEIFYQRAKDTEVCVWSLNCAEHKVFCSAHISILDPFSMSTPVAEDSEPVGDVEFL